MSLASSHPAKRTDPSYDHHLYSGRNLPGDMKKEKIGPRGSGGGGGGGGGADGETAMGKWWNYGKKILIGLMVVLFIVWILGKVSNNADAGAAWMKDSVQSKKIIFWNDLVLIDSSFALLLLSAFSFYSIFLFFILSFLCDYGNECILNFFNELF